MNAEKKKVQNYNFSECRTELEKLKLAYEHEYEIVLQLSSFMQKAYNLNLIEAMREAKSVVNEVNDN